MGDHQDVQRPAPSVLQSPKPWVRVASSIAAFIVRRGCGVVGGTFLYIEIHKGTLETCVTNYSGFAKP